LTAAAVALLALGVGLLLAAIATGQLVGWLLGLLVVLAGGLGGIAAVGAVQARYRQGPVEAELSTQIRREQHLARELDLLRPLGGRCCTTGWRRALSTGWRMCWPARAGW